MVETASPSPWVAWRRSAGANAIDAFFRSSSAVAKLHPSSRPEAHGIERLRDIPYRRGSPDWRHLLDVYRPRHASGPLPWVLYTHGGGFRILSKETHWVMALSFARQGFAVVVPNYRLSPAHPYPSALEDVSAALRWVYDEGLARFDLDPERVLFAGESAGANLATCLMISSCFERPEASARAVFDLGVVPQAVMPACGILQVSDAERLLRRKSSLSTFVGDRILDVERNYLGVNRAAAPEEPDLADPLLILEDDRLEPARALPPVFVSCGTADPLLDDSRRAHAALQARGVATELGIYPGGVHAFHAFVMREQARQCWRDHFAFLREHTTLLA